ncbi:MAG: metalloregulator ArsR/SmtB family transcription factor [Kiritimatiellia bacterium]|jgi:DNA-binding transcriptional ArsR family regulator|nr:metalloregulator ArsR/SmtB family transcription factor [Kiritimatiellia bacterium]
MGTGAMRTTLKITKALADRQRVRILMMLRSGELCVCRIVAVLGLAPSTVSKHLSLLSDAGLLDCRKDGRWAYYRLPRGEARKTVKPALKWLAACLAEDETALRDTRRLADVLAKAGESKGAGIDQRAIKEC